jgi:hypothetical protein
VPQQTPHFEGYDACKANLRNKKARLVCKRDMWIIVYNDMKSDKHKGVYGGEKVHIYMIA